MSDKVLKGFILNEDELSLIRDALEIAYEDHEVHHADAMALHDKLDGGLEGQTSYDRFIMSLITQMATVHGIPEYELTKRFPPCKPFAERSDVDRALDTKVYATGIRTYPLPRGSYLADALKDRDSFDKFTKPELGEPYPDGDEEEL